MVNESQGKRHYTVNELAELAGVTPTRVRQILLEGQELKGEKHGFMWLISAAEAERWIKTRQKNKDS